MKILILNAGSSSIKYQLFDMPADQALCTGLIERIGLENAHIWHKTLIGKEVQAHEATLNIPDHEAALRAAIEWIAHPEHGAISSVDKVLAVGHRVVHGGEQFADPVRITTEVKNKIRSLSNLVPLHNPANLQGIEVAERIFPHAFQVAVFDTAFHQSMPPVAYRTALPKHTYDEFGIRAYGFHGSSHQFVSRKAQEMMGRLDTKIVSIHLGNGCSIAAIKDGLSIDTSMGLGPLGGLVMGTRAGDVDPSVIFHLINERGHSPTKVHNMLNKESGLFGICGYSDMRDLKAAIEQGDADAQLAYELYAYRIRKYIGSYAAVLNGLDAIVFTAGVGENDAEMRAAVCHNMDYLGIIIDQAANAVRNAGARELQAPSSKVRIMVIPTNEELEIARQSFALLSKA